jgi:hypothetical protein
MPDNVYKVIELIGTSQESWEKAAKAAVERAAQNLRDLRGCRAGLGDRKGQSRSLSHEGEGLFQVRRQRLTLTAYDDKQDVEAPSHETLPQCRDRLRFDDVKGLDLQLAVKSRLVAEGL